MGHCDILGLRAMRGLGCHRQYIQPIRDTGVYSYTASVRSGLFGVVSALVCVCVGGVNSRGLCDLKDHGWLWEVYIVQVAWDEGMGLRCSQSDRV